MSVIFTLLKQEEPGLRHYSPWLFPKASENTPWLLQDSTGSGRTLMSGGATPGEVDHLSHVMQICLLAFGLWFFGRFMQLIRGSPLLGYIIAGIILGPPIADQVPYLDCFLTLGRLGVLLLILEAGLNMQVSMIRKGGCKAVMLTCIGMTTPIIMGMVLMLAFGYDVVAAFAAGAIFAPTSVGMATRILQDFDELETSTGQLIITVAILDDILSLVVLGVVQALGTSGVSPDTIWPILRPLVASIGFGVVLTPTAILWPYFVNWSKQYVPASLRQLYVMFGLMFMAFGFGVACATWATELLGVFAAGVAYSTVPEAHEGWSDHIGPIAGWLAKIFFVGIGFVLPLSAMLDPVTFAFGVLMSGPAIFGKVLTGLPFACPPLEGCKVGWGRVGRGEFAFFMAEVSRDSGLFDAKAFAIVIWALMIGSFIFPFVFRLIMMLSTKKTVTQLEENHEDIEMSSHPDDDKSMEHHDSDHEEHASDDDILGGRAKSHSQGTIGGRRSMDVNRNRHSSLDSGKGGKNRRRSADGSIGPNNNRRASDTRRSIEFGGQNVAPKIVVIPAPGEQPNPPVDSENAEHPRRARRTQSIMQMIGGYFRSDSFRISREGEAHGGRGSQS